MKARYLRTYRFDRILLMSTGLNAFRRVFSLRRAGG
jgi:hypothetical protein